MAQDLRQFTRAQILNAERPAWAENDGSAYHYDGILLWVRDRNGEAVARPEDAPYRGWRHRANCNCPLCRSD
jgi:hypothetical protein